MPGVADLRRKPRASAVLLGAFALQLTACAPAQHAVTARPPARLQAPAPMAENCRDPAWRRAAHINRSSLRQLPWTPFGRPEVGWETYAPLIAHEIGARCGPRTTGFARDLAVWERRHDLPADGLVSQLSFIKLKGEVQGRRPIVLLSVQGVCARAADERRLETSRPGEGYGGKQVELRPAAFAAWRRMVAAAREEDPQIAADPEALTIFSGYRSPTYDAARCAAQNNCNGVERATCSPHRTGLAMDLYVGHAPGYAADSSADANRLYMTRTPEYRWLLANAGRFGFVNYPFEPWHWEWTGEAP